MMKLTNLNIIKAILNENGFTFKKALGQNFLINPSVCPKMAEYACEGDNAGVIEIGPGIGVLTAELAKKAKKVVAVEIDERLKNVLAQTLAPFDNTEVVFADVLKLDINKLIKEKFCGMQVTVCANLPYYITSPVIMKLLEDRLPIEKIVVMVQKEAAERLCAPVGSRESGAITVAVNYYSEPKILFKVSRGSFYPKPNVDSAVISLNLRKQPPVNVEDERSFFGFVRAAFQQRRKTIVNSVSSSLNIDKQKFLQILDDLTLSPAIRAESLKLEQLAEIFNRLYKEMAI